MRGVLFCEVKLVVNLDPEMTKEISHTSRDERGTVLRGETSREFMRDIHVIDFRRFSNNFQLFPWAMMFIEI